MDISLARVSWHVAGVAVVVGALGGALATNGTGDPEPTRGAVRAAKQPELESPIDARREVSVSRSATRTAVDPSSWQVERLVQRRERALKELDVQVESQAQQLESEQWGLSVQSYRLTGTFGERSYLWSTVHTGLDFAARLGPQSLLLPGACHAGGLGRGLRFPNGCRAS